MYDPRLFPPPRSLYPLPAYRGPVYPQPAHAPVQGMPAGLLSSPSPEEVGGGLMGYLGDGSDFDVDGSKNGEVGSVGGLNPGASTDPGFTSEELGMKGRMTNARSLGMNQIESTLASMAFGQVPALGTALGAYNTISNVNNTLVNNKALANLGAPLTAAQQLGGFFGLNSYNGNLTDALNAAMQNQRGRSALTGMPSTQEINDQIASEQPDFHYEPPEKYSVEVQSLDDPSGSTDADLSGPASGDIDDEASGESDMGQDDYRSGGLLGDDGDGKFERKRINAHENEAVLKPESVGLLGDEVVLGLNNVASMNKGQKQKLVQSLFDAIMNGVPQKKTDFRASR